VPEDLATLIKEDTMKFGFYAEKIDAKTSERCVGTKIHNLGQLMDYIEGQTAGHGGAGDREPGQHFLQLPKECIPLVSCGVGKRTLDPQDYVPALDRGYVNTYLKRSKALPVTGVAAIVFTREAWYADPECAGMEMPPDVTHVLVDVLAFSDGPPPPLTPHRFVENMAGGNKAQMNATKEELHAEAEQVASYDRTWCVVADG
jgi:hypothetical protein